MVQRRRGPTVLWVCRTSNDRRTNSSQSRSQCVRRDREPDFLVRTVVRDSFGERIAYAMNCSYSSRMTRCGRQHRQIDGLIPGIGPQGPTNGFVHRALLRRPRARRHRLIPTTPVESFGLGGVLTSHSTPRITRWVLGDDANGAFVIRACEVRAVAVRRRRRLATARVPTDNQHRDDNRYSDYRKYGDRCKDPLALATTTRHRPRRWSPLLRRSPLRSARGLTARRRL